MTDQPELDATVDPAGMAIVPDQQDPDTDSEAPDPTSPAQAPEAEKVADELGDFA